MNRILSLLVLLLFTPAALADEQSWPNHGLTLFLPDGWTVIDETEEMGDLPFSSSRRPSAPCA